MGSALWLALLIVAAGTFAMRLLPMIWMRRRLGRNGQREGIDAIPQWLSLLGPMMIAAMLGGSLVPKTHDAIHWAATAFGVMLTAMIWRRTQSLGLPVFVGVVAFGLAYVALGN